MVYIRYIYAVGLFGILWSCGRPFPSKPIVIQEKQEIIEIQKEPAVVTLGDESITKTDLLAEFENLPGLDSVSNDALINEVIHKRLFIMEAQSRGMDTSALFKEEVETYKRIEIQNLLEDRTLLSALAEDSYQKYQSEINASHIFIPLSWYASSEDTLKVYNELMELRKYAMKNDNFAMLAKEWSKDPKTNMKGGSLGWFTAFHLIYPLEKAAYSTLVDSISLPVKTKAGYHLVKVNAKRANSGYVKVKHILKYLKVDVTKEQFEQTYKTLDSLSFLLKNGANFEELVVKYSDDFNSRETGGVLPIFGIGTREESTFEEAAFSLEKGEVSKPVRSISGLHLIKLIERYKPDSKEVFLKKIQPKLTTDSRAEYLQLKKFETLRKKHHLVVNEEIFAQCLNYADNRILERNWTMTPNEISNFVLFSIGQNKYYVSSFLKYVAERQEYEKWRVEEKPVEIFRMMFEKYRYQQLILAEEKSIMSANTDLERLFKFQKDNLIFSKFYNKAILEKSLDDSTGQREFFETHPELFPNLEVGAFTVVSFADTSIQNKFKVYRAGAKPYQLNRGIKPLYFAKDQSLLGLEEKRKLTGLLTIMKKNSGYIVEIGGHADKNEDEKVAALRIQQIVDYLVENGLPLTRILEVNYKSNKVQDRFDWTKNQRVSFQFFSNLESDLIKVFNERQAESIIYKTYTIDRTAFEKKLGLKWQNQTGVMEISGRTEEYSLKIKKATKSFKDYKYEVIEKYQDYLSQELTKNLAQKYRLNFDKVELNKILEAVKSNSK